MQKNNYLFLLILVIMSISCKKSNDTATGPTNTQLLTGHAWLYKAHAIDTNNNGVLDESSTVVPVCLQDDSLFFKTDNTVQLIRGTVLCDDPNDPSSDLDNSGTFQLLNNDTELTYHENNNGETLTGKITELSATSFVFAIKTVNGSTLSPVEFDIYNK